MNNQTFEKTMDQMLDISIQGINQAVAIKQREIAEKDQEIAKWKKIAYVIKQKYGQCEKHDLDDTRGFNLLEYLENVKCEDCETETRTLKGMKGLSK